MHSSNGQFGADRMTSSSKSSRHWRHVGSKTTPISSTITWMSMRSNSWFPHPMGTSPSSLPSKEFRSRSHWTVSTSSSRTSPSASTNNDVRCGDRECSRKPSTARRPATARDCVSLALVRFAHENAAARLVPAVLAGRGRPRRPRPFWSPPGLSIPHRATWSAGQVCTYRPAPLAAAALRVARSYTFSVRGVENAIF